ncbi:hypothetical protein J2I47_11680 [Fibrella sp. HMF5335]|uniref:Uncharacterized protein n=1 Tax=Fibrella rubiginis TaxID=2817060 RepID=A0A939K3C2_9BACT|nr:hypothetical protein [Fibrella rubiginis]MBO0937209.1 hypothetical protein [Fibrella rubiginis]
MLQIKPRNTDEQQFIEQFLKRTKIKFDVVEKETLKQKKQREFLEKLDRSLEDVKRHMRGEIELQSARDFLNEL